MLTLAIAQSMIATAMAAPRSSPQKRIAVAIADAGGHVLAMLREEGAPPLLARIAEAKAFTPIVYGRSTADLAPIADEYPIWFNGISRVAQASMGQPLIGSKGGLAFKNAAGAVIGAIGIAGETGDKDDELARLAIREAGFFC